MNQIYLSPEQVAEYTEILSKDPLKWAGDSISEIKRVVAIGSLEPTVHEITPVSSVEKNRDYLIYTIGLLEFLDLKVPKELQENIDVANEFLRG